MGVERRGKGKEDHSLAWLTLKYSQMSSLEKTRLLKSPFRLCQEHRIILSIKHTKPRSNEQSETMSTPAPRLWFQNTVPYGKEPDLPGETAASKLEAGKIQCEPGTSGHSGKPRSCQRLPGLCLKDPENSMRRLLLAKGGTIRTSVRIVIAVNQNISNLFKSMCLPWCFLNVYKHQW